jgi:hypothetical protein
MKPLHKAFATVLVLCVSFATLSGQNLKMNQTQVIGSHNSYKIGIEKPLLQVLVAERPEAKGLDYEHIPITDQLDLGLRSLEIDVLYDPQGGRYSEPKGLEMLRARGLEVKPYHADEMKAPGFKVHHVPDIDFRSHCATFKSCLSDIRNWSKSHNDHLPIIITINPKSSGIRRPGFTEVLPFDKKVLDALDQELLEVFDAENLITPKLVKGKHETLRKAIIADGWPDLSSSRGKILFVLDADTEITRLYLDGDDQYVRPMFSNTEPDNPHAAFFIMNDPVQQVKDIAERVKQGFMVRTRSDADTKEARTGDKSRFEAAIRSGAQVISTDYYLKSLSPDKDFEISFDGKYNQCNPLLLKSSSCKLE